MKEAQNDSATLNHPYPSVELRCLLEKETFPSQKVGEIFGMLQISCPSRNSTSSLPSPPVDFVVVIDVSSSMKDQNKLAHVQGAIEYMINRLIQDYESGNLQNPHRFCLIQFNDFAEVVTDSFVNLVPQNRDLLMSSLRSLRPGGSTNISQALFCALEIVSTSLERNQFITGNPDVCQMRGALANIMLLTDGLANSGLRGEEFVTKVKNMGIPAQITINTFGFGQDHDSSSLKSIALASSGGVYYYVPQPAGILSAFVEAISGAIHVRANDILVQAVAHDGCRVIDWFTTLPLQVNKMCKDYLFNVGTARESETRTILFKLSLRNMTQELQNHPLITFRVTLNNSITGTPETHQITGSVSRPTCLPSLSKSEDKRPFDLDEHINRWSTASAIQKAAELVTQSMEYVETAQKAIVSVLSQIGESISSDSKFCQQMEADLKRCGSAIGSCATLPEINPAIHLCNVISTMHFVERSAGMRSCISPRGIFYANSFSLSSDNLGSLTSLSMNSSTFSSPASGHFSLRGSHESNHSNSSDADMASALLRLDTRSCSDLNKKFNLQGDQSGFFFTSLGSLNEAAESDRYFVSYQREEIALARVQASKYWEHYIRRPISKTALVNVSSGSFSDCSTEICRKRSASGAPVVRKKLSCSQEGIQVAVSTATNNDFIVHSPNSSNDGITT